MTALSMLPPKRGCGGHRSTGRRCTSPIPPGCQLDDVMPMAELDQQSPCLIYWLDHWLPSHPMVLGLALPLRPMPALTDLSWAALVRSTES